ncbi:MAG: hypothetical protein AAGE93_14175 [Bacteroidota bacterium]
MKRLYLFIVVWFFPNLLLAQLTDVISRLEVYDIEREEHRIIYEEPVHFEAPNWSPDNRFFVINSLGKLYKISLSGGEKELIETGFADKCNNDHGISPDGKRIAFSHYDEPGVSYEDRNFMTSRIYTAPIEGGQPQVVTPNTPSFWHGWSPDGKTLIYTAFRDGEFDIYAIPTEGGQEKRLTQSPGLDDGADYSSDGKHIYYNSMQSGSMEIWRMQVDGSSPEQLTNDLYSNWFPHPSPDGRYLVFLSYLEDQGNQHPAMKPVALRLYDLASGEIKELTRFIGGQGTINVPSWSPDGKQFAFVSYEEILKPVIDAQYLYVLTDGDIPASAYIDGQLLPEQRVSEDKLTVFSVTKDSLAELSSVAVSNSVRRWPNSLSLDASQQYALIAEQDGPVPEGARLLSKIPPARLLTLVDVRNPERIEVVDTVAFDHIPAAVAFHPSDNLFSLTFIGSDSIALGRIEQDQIRIIGYSRITLANETVSAIPHFTWHPGGRFAAITLAGSDRLVFLKLERQDVPQLTIWGNTLKTSPLPGVGYFTHNGNFFVMTTINLTNDLEQSAYANNESLLSIYRFDSTDIPDSPRTRADDGNPTYTSPPIKHTLTATLPFGSGYVETFAISPKDRYIVGLNMEGSWLPDAYPGKTNYSSLSFFHLDAELGKAQFIDSYSFESILPECIRFDKSGKSIIVATYDHHNAREEKGSLDFWQIVNEFNQAKLTPIQFHLLPRGVHYFITD